MSNYNLRGFGSIIDIGIGEQSKANSTLLTSVIYKNVPNRCLFSMACRATCVPHLRAVWVKAPR